MTPKNSSYAPGVAGACRSKSNWNVAPGATVPLTPAGRSGASHEGAAKALARSRGCAVPSRVFESHAELPVFFSTSDIRTVLPAGSVNDCGGSGQFTLTYPAPHGGDPPANSCSVARLPL